MGILFRWAPPKDTLIMTTVAAEDRATQECDPSAAITYTGQGRRDRRLFLLPVLVAQSAKLQPAKGGLLLT